MTLLALGLILFLGVHSVRIVAERWRGRMIQRIGAGAWKGLYSLVALSGLLLIVHGYGEARQFPVVLWVPPLWTRHVAALLTLPAFVLLVAAYVPGNRLKARLRHPMILGVKLWALGHLLANGSVADLVLFGAFLLWAVFDYRAARRREAAMPAAVPGLVRDGLVLVIGVGVWVAFALWLHVWLIGVAPFSG